MSQPPTTTADAAAVVADLRPNERKPFVLVHVSTAAGREAFARYAVAMVDHDFVNLGHRGPLPLASRRALVRAAAFVLTDRPGLEALAYESGATMLEIEPNPKLSDAQRSD